MGCGRLAAAAAMPHADVVCPLLLLVILGIPFLSLLLLLYAYSSSSSSAPSNAVAVVSLRLSPPSPHIRMRRGAAFHSYDGYLRHQLNKMLDTYLRRVWATRDWCRKVDAFAGLFSRLRDDGLLSNGSRALCVGARLGQEVAALRLAGVRDAVGIDLAPTPPLVLRGDFHAQPFANAAFDFEFSNMFDHALYPGRFAAKIERTLRRDGGEATRDSGEAARLRGGGGSGRNCPSRVQHRADRAPYPTRGRRGCGRKSGAFLFLWSG